MPDDVDGKRLQEEKGENSELSPTSPQPIGSILLPQRPHKTQRKRPVANSKSGWECRLLPVFLIYSNLSLSKTRKQLLKIPITHTQGPHWRKSSIIHLLVNVIPQNDALQSCIHQ